MADEITARQTTALRYTRSLHGRQQHYVTRDHCTADNSITLHEITARQTTALRYTRSLHVDDSITLDEITAQQTTALRYTRSLHDRQQHYVTRDHCTVDNSVTLHEITAR